MQLIDLKNRINELIELGNKVKDTATNKSDSMNYPVNMTLFYEFRSSALSYLRNVFGVGHSYYKEFDKVTTENRIPPTLKAIGILMGAKCDIDGGWLKSTKSIANAEVLADFIDMAQHLLDAGYKDPAAVVLGSVLENHLKNVSAKIGIDTCFVKDGKRIPKKADVVNADLAKAGVYNSIDQKNVTAWLGLRNSAAHGKYADYSMEQVRLMNNSLLDFIQRIPI